LLFTLFLLYCFLWLNNDVCLFYYEWLILNKFLFVLYLLYFLYLFPIWLLLNRLLKWFGMRFLKGLLIWFFCNNVSLLLFMLWLYFICLLFFLFLLLFVSFLDVAQL
jgi:hypothetical protein